MAVSRFGKGVGVGAVALVMTIGAAGPAAAYTNGQAGTKSVQVCSTASTVYAGQGCSTVTVRCTWHKTLWWWHCDQ